MTSTCHHCNKPFLTQAMLVHHIMVDHHKRRARNAGNLLAQAAQQCALKKLDAELVVTRRTIKLLYP